MQRRTFHIVLDFFFIGAVVPVVLLSIWRSFFEHAAVVAQERFLQIAMVLWPTGLQILVVPHGENALGHDLAIAIMVVQNAILYSTLALVVHWLVARMRRARVPQVH